MGTLGGHPHGPVLLLHSQIHFLQGGMHAGSVVHEQPFMINFKQYTEYSHWIFYRVRGHAVTHLKTFQKSKHYTAPVVTMLSELCHWSASRAAVTPHNLPASPRGSNQCLTSFNKYPINRKSSYNLQVLLCLQRAGKDDKVWQAKRNDLFLALHNFWRAISRMVKTYIMHSLVSRPSHCPVFNCTVGKPGNEAIQSISKNGLWKN